MKDFSSILTAYMHNMFPQGGQETDVLALYKAFADKEMTDANGKTLYHVAARFFDIEAIEYLASKGVRLRLDRAGNTPLHDLTNSPYTNDIRNVEKKADAIYRSAKKLIELNVNPKRKNEEGTIAYIKAGVTMMYPFLQAMADCGVKMDEVDAENRNLLHLIVEQAADYKAMPEVMEAARRTMQVVLESGSVDPSEQDVSGTTPLTYARRYQMEELATLLSGETETTGITPEEAVRNKDLQAMESLIDSGLELNGTDENLRTPLMLACEYPSQEMVKLLVKKGADVNYKKGENEYTAVYYLLTAAVNHLDVDAAGEQQDPKEIVRILRTLVDNGLKVNDTVDDEGNTALHVVCGTDYLAGLNNRLAEELIEAGSDVNQANLAGQTPLMIFAGQGDEQKHGIAELLLDHGTEINAVDKLGNTALMYAADNTNKVSGRRIAKLLVGGGKYTLERSNNRGQTALDIAVKAGNEEVIQFLLSKIQ